MERNGWSVTVFTKLRKLDPILG